MIQKKVKLLQQIDFTFRLFKAIYVQKTSISSRKGRVWKEQKMR